MSEIQDVHAGVGPTREHLFLVSPSRTLEIKANSVTEAHEWKAAFEVAITVRALQMMRRQEMLAMSSIKAQAEAMRERYTNMLVSGDVFKKWPEGTGRKGEGQSRRLWCTPNLGSLNWGDVAAGAKSKGAIELAEITEVQPDSFSYVILTIVSVGRILDLEAKSQQARDQWVRALRYFCEFRSLLPPPSNKD